MKALEERQRSQKEGQAAAAIEEAAAKMAAAEERVAEMRSHTKF
jgi:hypothetical protein